MIAADEQSRTGWAGLHRASQGGGRDHGGQGPGDGAGGDVLPAGGVGGPQLPEPAGDHLKQVGWGRPRWARGERGGNQSSPVATVGGGGVGDQDGVVDEAAVDVGEEDGLVDGWALGGVIDGGHPLPGSGCQPRAWQQVGGGGHVGGHDDGAGGDGPPVAESNARRRLLVAAGHALDGGVKVNAAGRHAGGELAGQGRHARRRHADGAAHEGPHEQVDQAGRAVQPAFEQYSGEEWRDHGVDGAAQPACLQAGPSGPIGRLAQSGGGGITAVGGPPGQRSFSASGCRSGLGQNR